MQFQLRRVKGFWREFRRSKRGLLGIAILLAYSVFALSAPLLTPYDPIRSQFLSGQLGAPTWWRYLPGGESLSQNFALVPRSGFTQASDFQDQGWVASTSPSTTNLSVQFNSSVTGLSSPGVSASGGEGISYVRGAGSQVPSSQGVEVTISKTFDWPYDGPPKNFIGTMFLLTAELRGVESLTLTAFIAKGNLPITVGNQTISSTFVNRLVNPDLNSNSATMKALLGGSQTIDPGGVIFFEKGVYSYGFKILIPDQDPAKAVSVKLYFNNLQLLMKGTSFGFLGTDQVGRDIFSQLAYGTRISLLVGLVASFLGVVVGLFVGLVAGYLGKVVDEILMRFTDLILVLPGLPLLIVLAALLGPSIWNIILVLGFLGWPGFARVVRSQVLSLKERSFIEASKAAGSGAAHIITRHVLPNVMSLTYVSLALAVPTAIVSEAALSFLGLRDPTVVSWGGMLLDVQDNNGITNWWWVLPPGLSIAALSLSFVLLGYALDELLNPKLRVRR